MIRVTNVHIVASRVLGGLCLFACVCAGGSAAARPKAKKPEPAASAQIAPTSPAPAAPPEAAPQPAAHSDSEPGADQTSSTSAQAESAAPAAAASAEAPSAGSEVKDQEQLASLQNEVAQLIDDMVQARTKAALLGKTLFKTRLLVLVQNLAVPDPVLGNIVLKLDGAPVFRSDGSALRDDNPRKVFESFVAPGPHVLTVELEQKASSDAAYGYTLHDSYRFQALRDKQSELTLILDDDSDLAREFPQDAQGEYDVRTKLRVRTRELGRAGN